MNVFFVALLCFTLFQVKQILDEIFDKVPDPFNIADMMARVEERTPYIIVAFQECERMNNLMGEIRRSLKELSLGLKVSFMYKTIIQLKAVFIKGTNYSLF